MKWEEVAAEFPVFPTASEGSFGTSTGGGASVRKEGRWLSAERLELRHNTFSCHMTALVLDVTLFSAFSGAVWTE